MSKVLSILLSFLFLITSTGVHLDFAYCGDELMHIEFSHSDDMQESCCLADTQYDCCETQEIVQDPQLLDYIPVSSFEFGSVPFAILDYQDVSVNVLSAQEISLDHLPRPPDLVQEHSAPFLQRFIC